MAHMKPTLSWCYYSAEKEMAHMKTFKEYGEKFEKETTLSWCNSSAEGKMVSPSPDNLPLEYLSDADLATLAAQHSRQETRPAEYSLASYQFLVKNELCGGHRGVQT